MRFLISIFIAALCISTQAFALTEADGGVFAIVHRDGNVTDKIFRVRQVDGVWRLEDKKPDGRWEDVTCSGDCKFRESSEADLNRFFTASDLLQIKASCIQNVAFAFCSYSGVSQANIQGHVFIALVTGQPIHIRLVRAKANP